MSAGCQGPWETCHRRSEAVSDGGQLRVQQPVDASRVGLGEVDALVGQVAELVAYPGPGPADDREAPGGGRGPFNWLTSGHPKQRTDAAPLVHAEVLGAGVRARSWVPLRLRNGASA